MTQSHLRNQWALYSGYCRSPTMRATLCWVCPVGWMLNSVPKEFTISKEKRHVCTTPGKTLTRIEGCRKAMDKHLLDGWGFPGPAAYQRSRTKAMLSAQCGHTQLCRGRGSTKPTLLPKPPICQGAAPQQEGVF